jgi:acetate kinase
MKVLVINCGSSSIKYQLYQMPETAVLAKGTLERIGEPASRLVHSRGAEPHEHETPIADHEHGMALILDTLVNPRVGVIASTAEIGACGHRVVHGGEEFTGSVLVDDHVIASIERFADLAPLHNPANLTGLRAAQRKLPGVPQVACFDTAFHATIPEVAYTYAFPRELYEKFHIRRYGFHGTSHRYVARRAAQILGRGKYDVNVITCHLGNGCSMTAVKNGRSVDTSMGLTPLEGLVMGTRSGDFDPAIIFYLAGKGYDMAALNALCNKKSGLLGLSGVSNDMRNLLERAAKGDRNAALAIDVFCYRIKKYIGAYMAVLGAVDAVVFTGGIGENAAAVRAKSTSGLAPLGIEIDPRKNEAAVKAEADVSAPAARTKVLVIPTNEEAAIANDTYVIATQGVIHV